MNFFITGIKIYFVDYIIMTEIIIEKCVFSIHPIYDLYAADSDGNVINIIKKVPTKGAKKHNGYLMVGVRKHAQPSYKTYHVHRFIYECFNGVIPEGKVIDHINNIKDDNRLCNLQLVTPQQNCKKSAKDRDYTFVANNRKNRRCVKVINQNTNEVSYYNSMYSIQQHLGINAGIVKMVSEGLNNNKSGVSKKDGHMHSYVFQYIKQDELPSDYKKSANIRPKMSDEDRKKHNTEHIEKWQKKEYKCLNCNKVYKNGYKYIHKKHCKNSQKQ